MSKKNKLNREQAKKMVEELLGKAKTVFKTNKKKADLFVHKARNIAMKVKLRMDPELKRKFCKYCHSYLMPGENLRVRLQKGKVVYFCQNCHKHWRMPYIAEKKAKRKAVTQK